MPDFNLTATQLRRIADILESNSDQRGFDFWSAVAAMEAEDLGGSETDDDRLNADERKVFKLIDSVDTLTSFVVLPQVFWKWSRILTQSTFSTLMSRSLRLTPSVICASRSSLPQTTCPTSCETRSIQPDNDTED
jgi:hypothetical protein